METEAISGQNVLAGVPWERLVTESWETPITRCWTVSSLPRKFCSWPLSSPSLSLFNPFTDEGLSHKLCRLGCWEGRNVIAAAAAAIPSLAWYRAKLWERD